MSDLTGQSADKHLGPVGGRRHETAITGEGPVFMYWINQVNSFLEVHGLDPDKVVFAGHDRNTLFRKDENGEHGSTYFFGDYKSLQYPRPEDPDNDEEAAERWIVNPIHYALEYGVKGCITVYEKEKLFADKTVEIDEEFGTYCVEMPGVGLEEFVAGKIVIAPFNRLGEIAIGDDVETI